MKKQRLYRKLAAAHQFGVATGGWVSLHLAADHLLLRSSAFFVERYHRFYFRDVEAITIAHTIRGHVWSVAFGAGIVFSSVPMLITRQLHTAALAFDGFFLLLLLINIARGPTCITRLQTRVQTPKLPLRRVRKAVRVVEKLAPLIHAAQAELPTSAAAAGTSPRLTSAAVETPLRAEPPPLPGERAAAPLLSHFFAATALMLSAIVVFMSARQPESGALAFGAVGAVMANLGLALTALVQQRRHRTPRRLQPMAWISVSAHAIAIPVVYFVFTMIHGFQNADTETKSAFGEVPLAQLRALPGFSEVLWIYGGFAVLLGFTWLLLFVWSNRRRARE